MKLKTNPKCFPLNARKLHKFLSLYVLDKLIVNLASMSYLNWLPSFSSTFEHLNNFH